MKKTITSVFTCAILLASCSEATKTDDSASKAAPKEKVEEAKPTVETIAINEEHLSPEGSDIEEELMPEGSAVEGDTRYDNMSSESAISDCYITGYFIDMDIEYITVDFITYKLDEDSKNTDYEIYDVVNDNPQLRTFYVAAEYKDCGDNKTVSLADLVKASQDNPETIFKLETTDGVVTSLFIDTCSG